jgi:hypothetical protein
MPFYDDFDLSTVDLLLISQYVRSLFFCLFACFGVMEDWEDASLLSDMEESSTLYMRNNGIYLLHLCWTAVMPSPGPL